MPGLEVVGESLTVDAEVVSRKRFGLGTAPEIFSDVQFAAVDAPVIMTFVAVPPSIHPVGTDTPTLPEIEFCTDVRNQGRIVEQIRFQRHVERLAGRRFRLHWNFDGNGG